MSSSPTTKKRKAPRRGPVPPEISSARRYAAWQMRVMNTRMTYAEITRELNKLYPDYPLKSDHQAVEKMIKEAEKEFIAAHKDRVEEIKAEAAATLDWVTKEAARAWEKSRDQIVDLNMGKDKSVIEKVVITAGNAQYLRRITESVETKTKIFGALAPKKHEVTGKDGKPLVPPSIDFKSLGKYLSNEDLDVLHKAAAIIERAQRDLEAAVIEGD